MRTLLHALWLLREDWSMEGVAGVVGVHYRTVQRWVGWYRQGGIAEVCARHGGGHGQPAWLTPEQEAVVADQFGVTYRPKGIYRLLRRARCCSKVPRPIYAKADLQAKEDWKKAAAQPCGQPE